jgi:hypothetical protein
MIILPSDWRALFVGTMKGGGGSRGLFESSVISMNWFRGRIGIPDLEWIIVDWKKEPIQASELM